jgi:hypothetical protein
MKRVLTVVTVALTSAVVACGGASGIEGMYQDPSGAVKLELKDGKAYLSMGALASEGTYELKDDQIIVRERPNDPDPLILTRDADGALRGPSTSPIGRLTKQGS